MIQVEHLTKRYGRRTAVDDLCFDVRAGEVVGFLGPNGAGKTTAMRILACFLPPTGGRVRVAGFDILRDSYEVRRRVGYMPENVPLYPDMRVVEYLSWRARLKGVSGRQLRQHLDEVIVTCGLEDAYTRIIGQLSRGFRQRVGLADALVHKPEVLILDEPSIGLDPNQIRQIRALIRSLAGRFTVLLSSHILPEVETICERVLIINEGRIVASDAPGHLVGLMKGNTHVSVEVCGPADAVQESLADIPGVVRVSGGGEGPWRRFRCECSKGLDIREEVFRVVTRNNWSLRELATEKKNLEDVFVAVTAEKESS